MDPATRAGLERLLMGGTPEQLDQAAFSLLRTGYPLAAQMCAVKAIGMRRFEEDRKAHEAHRARLLAAQAASTQAHAATAAQSEAQAQAVADAAAKMHQIAAQKPAVLAPQVVSPPGVSAPAFAPPTAIAAAPGETPLPAQVKEAVKVARIARKAARAKSAPPAVSSAPETGLTFEPPPHAAHANGRATPEH